MQHVYPDYYKAFRCIADKCRHNCCIGWEIDIDEGTADFYKSVTGDFGKRLKDSIDFSEEAPYFIPVQDERCPFLNGRNLCDIITELGEDRLCTICAEHPRFHNELPDRTESGLGLCCEEAARIILSKKDKTRLIAEGECDCEDEIINLRDKVIEALQCRSLSIDKRIENMLSLCNAELVQKSIPQWAQLLLDLERLDEKWTDILTLLRDKGSSTDFQAFNTYMNDRQAEYEQFCVYLIYRHFANAPDLEEAGIRASFTALCCMLIRATGAVLLTENGEFTFEEQVDLCRMFSSEIEYSDENLYIIFDELR